MLSSSPYSKKQLASILGYKNVNKGIRRIDAAISCPQQNEKFARVVVTILGGSLWLFDVYVEQDRKVEFEPTVHLVPSKTIPKYPLYSRYALEKELRQPLSCLLLKKGFRVDSEAVTLKVLQSLGQGMVTKMVSDSEHSQIRFKLSNYLTVNLALTGK